MEVVMKTVSCPPPWKLAVQGNNTVLTILSLDIRRTPQLEEDGLFATAKVGHAGPEDNQQPPEVKEKTMGSTAESSPPSPGATSTQPFCDALACCIGAFTFFFISTSLQHIEQHNCLCSAQLTTVFISLQCSP